MLLIYATVPAHQRSDVADQDPDPDSEEDDDDQRRLKAGEEELEADLLGVLQGDDQGRRQQRCDLEDIPVDGVMIFPALLFAWGTVDPELKVRFFEDLARETKLPIVLFQIPVHVL